jgi:serine/threonine protein kinase
MVTGRRAFQKPSSAETMTAILKEDPPSLALSATTTPPALQRVVNRCLEKNPERRFQSASDLAFALEALSDSGTSSGIAQPSQATTRSWNWRQVAGGIVAFLAAAGMLAWLTSPARPPRVMGTTQLTHDGVHKYNIATDGTRLYIGESGGANRIVQVSVNGGDTSPIPTPFANAVSTEHLAGSHAAAHA